ncbi:hypothetical protein PG999_001274 [Apiospora kogelbergensis]|uniref:Ankyrin n=1 Tax=Apiospora kogelbergensis TaxID=1337665 RepID=A0AAW0REC1_9PEZI
MATQDQGGGGFFDRLSDDLVLIIADMAHIKDLSRLVRTSNRMHTRLNPYLWISGMKRDGRPLQYACRKYGRDDMITRLLSHHGSWQDTEILEHRFRFDYNARARGRTPLLLAVQSSNLPAVRTLLDHGADVGAPLHSKQMGGRSASIVQPIHAALLTHQHGGDQQTRDDILELLVNRGADVDAQCPDYGTYRVLTPLFFAIIHGTQRAIALLLSRGASVSCLCNIRSWGRFTPFNLFLRTKMQDDYITYWYEVIVLFIKAGAKQNVLNPMLLECLKPHKDEKWADIINLLLESGADPKIVTESGDPCLVHFLKLHQAWPEQFSCINNDRICKASMRIIQSFAKAGVTINYRDPRTACSQTPFMIAASLPVAFNKLFFDILNTLPVDVRVRDRNGGTALHSMFYPDGQLVANRIAPLVAKGCPINARDRDGNTLLHMAAKAGMTGDGWLDKLVKHDFDCWVKNKEGQTFIDIVCYRAATPFEPARYEQHLADYLHEMVDNCLKAEAEKRQKYRSSKPRSHGRSKGKTLE